MNSQLKQQVPDISYRTMAAQPSYPTSKSPSPERKEPTTHHSPPSTTPSSPSQPPHHHLSLHNIYQSAPSLSFISSIHIFPSPPKKKFQKTRKKNKKAAKQKLTGSPPFLLRLPFLCLLPFDGFLEEFVGAVFVLVHADRGGGEGGAEDGVPGGEVEACDVGGEHGCGGCGRGVWLGVMGWDWDGIGMGRGRGWWVGEGGMVVRGEGR